MVTFRPETPGDEPFLRALDGGRHAQLAAGLDPTLTGILLDQQYEARRRGYDTAFPGARREIVLADGVPVGVFITDEHGPAIQLIDIALVPEAQGAGIGSAVLSRMAEAADRAQRTIRLHVDPVNVGARALYARFGFVVTAAESTEVTMQRPPEAITGR